MGILRNQCYYGYSVELLIALARHWNMWVWLAGCHFSPWGEYAASNLARITVHSANIPAMDVLGIFTKLPHADEPGPSSRKS